MDSGRESLLSPFKVAAGEKLNGDLQMSRTATPTTPPTTPPAALSIGEFPTKRRESLLTPEKTTSHTPSSEDNPRESLLFPNKTVQSRSTTPPLPPSSTSPSDRRGSLLTPTKVGVTNTEGLNGGANASGSGSAQIWTKLFDETSQTHYYYNEVTGLSVWEAPDGYVDEVNVVQHRETDWWRFWSDEHNRYFYTNQATNEKTWVKPEGVAITCHDGGGKGEGVATGEEQWVAHYISEESKYFYTNLTTGENTWEFPQTAESVWHAVYSQEHSQYFYLNEATGEKTWAPPSDQGKTVYPSSEMGAGAIGKDEELPKKGDVEKKQVTEEEVSSVGTGEKKNEVKGRRMSALRRASRRVSVSKLSLSDVISPKPGKKDDNDDSTVSTVSTTSTTPASNKTTKLPATSSSKRMSRRISALRNASRRASVKPGGSLLGVLKEGEQDKNREGDIIIIEEKKNYYADATAKKVEQQFEYSAFTALTVKSRQNGEVPVGEKDGEVIAGEKGGEVIAGEKGGEMIAGEESEEVIAGEESEEVIAGEESEEVIAGEESEEVLPARESGKQPSPNDQSEQESLFLQETHMVSGTTKSNTYEAAAPHTNNNVNNSPTREQKELERETQSSQEHLMQLKIITEVKKMKEKVKRSKIQKKQLNGYKNLEDEFIALEYTNALRTLEQQHAELSLLRDCTKGHKQQLEQFECSIVDDLRTSQATAEEIQSTLLAGRVEFDRGFLRQSNFDINQRKDQLKKLRDSRQLHISQNDSSDRKEQRSSRRNQSPSQSLMSKKNAHSSPSIRVGTELCMSSDGTIFSPTRTVRVQLK